MTKCRPDLRLTLKVVEFYKLQDYHMKLNLIENSEDLEKSGDQISVVQRIMTKIVGFKKFANSSNF